MNTQRETSIIGDGDEMYWRHPGSLRNLALMNTAWWDPRRRLKSRPGTPAGWGPVDVLAMYTSTQYAARTLAAITDTVFALASHGFLVREVADDYERTITAGNSANVLRCGPAVFGYCNPTPDPDPTDPLWYQRAKTTQEKLHEFAGDFPGINILDRSTAADDAVGLPGAPHVHIGGVLAPSGRVGAQRTAMAIGKEWAGCHVDAVQEIVDGRQIVLYGPNLWTHLHTRFAPVPAPR